MGTAAALAARAASDGTRVVVTESRTAATGVMPPLYVHAENESYYVVEGEITFYVGDEIVHARAGDAVPVAGGLERTFRVTSEGARWLVATRARSYRRYDDFARALARPAASWPSPEEEASIGAIAGANGIEILGPPGTLPS